MQCNSITFKLKAICIYYMISWYPNVTLFLVAYWEVILTYLPYIVHYHLQKAENLSFLKTSVLINVKKEM